MGAAIAVDCRARDGVMGLVELLACQKLLCGNCG